MAYALPNFSTDLTGQTALVTGASSGLGLRFARTLAKAGAKVALTARRLDRLEQHAADIKAAGGEAIGLQLDVTDANQLKEVVGKAEARLGPVTILINNAGIPDAQRAVKMSTDLIDRVMTEFNALWEGHHCKGCGRRDVCPVPLEEPKLVA